MDTNFTLKSPPRNAPKGQRHKRSSSFSAIEDSHSVHWISPSVFKHADKKSAGPYLFTLAEMFSASSVVAAKPKGKRCRNEASNAPKYKSKKVKREEMKATSNQFITLKKPSRPESQCMRLSYILSNDPYNVLSISPGATKSVIKKIYKKRAIELHPDKGGDKEEFVRLRNAYEILVDDRKRKVYEEHGMEGIGKMNNGLLYDNL
eukprot:TRINITY_DN10224_c0_g1_i1.p1 TRINITY_DN10224_c0_g1~~TRINITY_DN10224_c0_g1_i1.p1  ORF type:complete len:205 (+),score=33.65 TRINITY_DN10224_c0_g1_i1:118-732(+)